MIKEALNKKLTSLSIIVILVYRLHNHISNIFSLIEQLINIVLQFF